MLKTGLLNFISVLVKVITGLFLNKIMALYVGPAGYALVSQFQNGINFITTFASGAINTGVTKYTAEYANDISFRYLATFCSINSSRFVDKY